MNLALYVAGAVISAIGFLLLVMYFLYAMYYEFKHVWKFRWVVLSLFLMLLGFILQMLNGMDTLEQVAV